MKCLLKKRGTVFLIIALLLTTIFSISFSRYFASFNRKIVLKVREPSYTVVFNSNGGIGTMNNQNFVYGESANLNANIYENDGYSFKEWNTKSDGSGTSYQDEENVNNLTNKLYSLYPPKAILSLQCNLPINIYSGLNDGKISRSL